MVWHTPFAWLGLDLPLVATLTSFAAGAIALVLLVRYCWQLHGLIATLLAGGREGGGVGRAGAVRIRRLA